MLTRRNLLRATTALIPAAALAACANTPLTPAEIVAQAGAVASGLAGMLPQLISADPSLIPAATVTQIQGYLGDAQTAAANLSASLPAVTGAVTVQTVEGDINAVLKVLAAPPINGLIPAPFNMAVAAAAIVVPSLEAFVNTYLPTASVSPVAVAVRAKLRAGAPQVATVDQAMAVLQRYSKH